MTVFYCPECHHEIERRGRFCMFCGCDLRKTARVSVHGKEAGPAEPERDHSFGLKGLTVAAVILMLVAVAGFIWTRNSRGSSDIYGLRPGMTYNEVCEKLEAQGFERSGDPEVNEGTLIQRFKSNRVYGYDTYFSTLEMSEREISFLHCYMGSRGMPAGVPHAFNSVRGELTRKYGEPGFVSEEGTYIAWEDGDRSAALLMAGEMFTVVERTAENHL